MALDYRTTYGIQVLSGDPGYPYGKARNVTVSGDGTGTPWEQSLVNDWFGFLQSLLSASSATPSGTPDAVGASQYLDGVKFLTKNIVGTVNVTGAVIATQQVVGKNIAVTSNGTFFGGGTNTVTGSRFIEGNVFEAANTFQEQITVSLGGIVVGGGFVAIGNGLDGIIIQTGGLNIQGGTVICVPPETFHDEIILADTGRIRERVAYAPDANHTFAATDGTVIVAQSGVITAPRTWTLGDAAAEGATLKLVNYSGSAITLHNSGGGSLLTVGSSALPALSGTTPGVVRLVWLSNGLYTGWSGA